MKLTKEQVEEMRAIARTCADLGGKPTFQSNLNLPFYQPLADAGFLTIGPHPDFTDDFKAIALTPAGLAAIGH